jgi:hypothetical protein
MLNWEPMGYRAVSGNREYRITKRGDGAWHLRTLPDNILTDTGLYSTLNAAKGGAENKDWEARGMTA